MAWTEPLSGPWLWALHGRPRIFPAGGLAQDARGSDEAVRTGAGGLFGGVGETAGVGVAAVAEAAWRGWTQVSLMSERTVLAVEEVEPSEQ